MPFILTSAMKDLRRRFADPAALLMWIGLPVVIGGLMSLISGDSGPLPKARVLLVDEDKTLISGLLAGAGRQGPLAQVLEIEPVDAAAGQKRMDAGDATALLIIPKGFQDGVLREQPTMLTLVTNPAQRILPAMIEEGLNVVVEATFYAQRLFGPAIQDITASTRGTTGPTDERVAAISRSINQRIRTLQDTLLPPALSLEAKTESSEAESPGFWALFLPGLLFMAMMFTAQGMTLDIWIEKTKGTLRRTLSTPQHALAFLAGKLLAAVAIMSLATLVALTLGVVMFHVPITRAPMALVWTAYAGGALFCYLTLVQVISTNARGAQLLSALIVFPFIMIGGSFFPFEAMPAWMTSIGRWTPNGQAVMQVKQILFGRLDSRSLLTAAVAIGVPAAVAFFLSLRRLAGRFAID